jgi:hypothetical protein
LAGVPTGKVDNLRQVLGERPTLLLACVLHVVISDGPMGGEPAVVVALREAVRNWVGDFSATCPFVCVGLRAPRMYLIG